MPQEKDPTSALHPVETCRASEIIYNQIRDMIVSGELKAGDRLPSERNMMKQLKRSRPTIREALRMLERSGYIHTVAGSNGAIVQKLGTRFVEQDLEALLAGRAVTLTELYEIRYVTELATARWAAERRSEETMAYLENLLCQMEENVENYDTFISLDPKFHAALGKAANNNVAYIISNVFSNMIETINRRSTRQLSEDTRRSMCRKINYMHRCILNAVRNRDPEAAEEAMRIHVQAFRLDLEVAGRVCPFLERKEPKEL